MNTHTIDVSRFVILMAGICCIGVLLVVRLADVQLMRGELFRARAEDNRHFTHRVPAERGVLLDRYLQPLVWNKRQYLAMTDSGGVHPDRTPINREEALAQMATETGQVTYSLFRQYRFPRSTSQVLGYVGPVTAEELLADSTLHIQSQVGKLGLERRFDEQLRGRDGQEIFEINALGQRQRAVSRTEPLAGQNIVTSIDPYISEVAWQALGDQTGAVIISDASSGAILSMVSKPSFDANIFGPPGSQGQTPPQRSASIKAALEDPRQLFFNRAASGSYPPGSVFKLVTALAGLEKGSIQADTVVVDEGVLKVGEYEYGNWYFSQYGRTEGPISLVRAIARSNDIYFYKAAEWIGPTALATIARQFGFGAAPGTELYAEAKGLVPDPTWKETVIGERWYLGNTYHFGIGQGDLLESPLQVLQMTQAVAHQGSLCQPTFLLGTLSKCREIGLKPEFVELVSQGMLEACSATGTAFPFFPRNTELRTGGSIEQDLQAGAIACKTGTAEFGGQDDKGRRKTHGWFVAIVEPHIDITNSEVDLEPIAVEPVESDVIQTVDRKEWLGRVSKAGFPKRVVFTVLVESDEANTFKEGSRDAGPVVKTILDWMEGK